MSGLIISIKRNTARKGVDSMLRGEGAIGLIGWSPFPRMWHLSRNLKKGRKWGTQIFGRIGNMRDDKEPV